MRINSAKLGCPAARPIERRDAVEAVGGAIGGGMGGALGILSGTVGKGGRGGAAGRGD